MKTVFKTQILKLVAVTTLCIFVVSDILWAIPPGGITFSPTRETPSFLEIQIPKELASIEEIYEAPAKADPSLVMHIQNIHGNYEAQRQIKKLLGYLYEEYGFKLLFIEGAASELDREYLELFEKPENNLALADRLTREGQMNGVEYYLMDSPKDVRAVGIEDAKLYRQNYEDFKEVHQAENETKNFLQKVEQNLESVSSRIFSQETRRLLSEWRKFEAGHRDFLPYVKRLSQDAKKTLGLDLGSLFSQMEWPQLTRILVLQEMEKDLDLNAAHQEKARVIEFLKQKRVSKEMISAIERLDEKRITLAKSEAVPAGRQESRKYEDVPRYLFEKLAQEAAPKGFYFHQYPAFSLWAGHIILKNELDSKELFREINKIFEKILNELTITEKEKNLLELYRDANLLEKLLNLKLTREEWQRATYRSEWLKPGVIQTRITKLTESSLFGRGQPARRSAGGGEGRNPHPPASAGIFFQREKGIAELYTTAQSFYEIARQREDAFYETLTKEMKASETQKAVLVTGGFHTEGMMEKLREEEINYSVLMPKLKGTHLDQRNYIETMLETKPTMFDVGTIEYIGLLQDAMMRYEQGLYKPEEKGALIAEIEDLTQELKHVLQAFVEIGIYETWQEAAEAFNYFNGTKYSHNRKVRLNYQDRVLNIKINGKTLTKYYEGKDGKLQANLLDIEVGKDKDGNIRAKAHLKRGQPHGSDPTAATTSKSEGRTKEKNKGKFVPEAIGYSKLIEQVRKGRIEGNFFLKEEDGSLTEYEPIRVDSSRTSYQIRAVNQRTNAKELIKIAKGYDAAAGTTGVEALSEYAYVRRIRQNPHPNILSGRVLTTGDAHPQREMGHLVVLPWLEDLKKIENYSVQERVRILLQVLEGVNHLHKELEISHRDLKEDNILITERDGKPFAGIIDFGEAGGEIEYGGLAQDLMIVSQNLVPMLYDIKRGKYQQTITIIPEGLKDFSAWHEEYRSNVDNPSIELLIEKLKILVRELPSDSEAGKPSSKSEGRPFKDFSDEEYLHQVLQTTRDNLSALGVADNRERKMDDLIAESYFREPTTLFAAIRRILKEDEFEEKYGTKAVAAALGVVIVGVTQKPVERFENSLGADSKSVFRMLQEAHEIVKSVDSSELEEQHELIVQSREVLETIIREVHQVEKELPFRSYLWREFKKLAKIFLLSSIIFLPLVLLNVIWTESILSDTVQLTVLVDKPEYLADAKAYYQSMQDQFPKGIRYTVEGANRVLESSFIHYVESSKTKFGLKLLMAPFLWLMAVTGLRIFKTRFDAVILPKKDGSHIRAFEVLPRLGLTFLFFGGLMNVIDVLRYQGVLDHIAGFLSLGDIFLYLGFGTLFLAGYFTYNEFEPVRIPAAPSDQNKAAKSESREKNELKADRWDELIQTLGLNASASDVGSKTILLQLNGASPLSVRVKYADSHQYELQLLYEKLEKLAFLQKDSSPIKKRLQFFIGFTLGVSIGLTLLVQWILFKFTSELPSPVIPIALGLLALVIGFFIGVLFDDNSNAKNQYQGYRPLYLKHGLLRYFFGNYQEQARQLFEDYMKTYGKVVEEPNEKAMKYEDILRQAEDKTLKEFSLREEGGSVTFYKVEKIEEARSAWLIYAINQNTDKPEAIKVLNRHMSEMPDFLSSGEHLYVNRIKDNPHPNILNGRLLYTGDDALPIPMVTRPWLRDYVLTKNYPREGKPKIFLQIAKAVQHLHGELGIAHMDLNNKGNILVTERNGEPWVQIIDFGEAFELDSAGPEYDRDQVLAIGRLLLFYEDQLRRPPLEGFEAFMAWYKDYMTMREGTSEALLGPVIEKLEEAIRVVDGKKTGKSEGRAHLPLVLHSHEMEALFLEDPDGFFQEAFEALEAYPSHPYSQRDEVSERVIRWQASHNEPGALLELREVEEIIVIGDRHSAYAHLSETLRELRIRSLLKKNPNAHVILLGDGIHTPNRLINNEEANAASFNDFLLAVRLKNSFPLQVHLLPGNHEYAHLAPRFGGESVFRGKVDLGVHFEKMLFGDGKRYPGSVMTDFSDYIRDLPVAILIRSPDNQFRIFASHSGVAPSLTTLQPGNHQGLVDLTQYRDFRYYQQDEIAEEPFHQLMWARPFEAGSTAIRDFRRRLGADLLLGGHTALHNTLLEKHPLIQRVPIPNARGVYVGWTGEENGLLILDAVRHPAYLRLDLRNLKGPVKHVGDLLAPNGKSANRVFGQKPKKNVWQHVPDVMSLAGTPIFVMGKGRSLLLGRPDMKGTFDVIAEKGKSLMIGKANQFKNFFSIRDNPEMEDRHVEFRFVRGQGWEARDLGSKKGTLLNGKRLSASGEESDWFSVRTVGIRASKSESRRPSPARQDSWRVALSQRERRRDEGKSEARASHLTAEQIEVQGTQRALKIISLKRSIISAYDALIEPLPSDGVHEKSRILQRQILRNLLKEDSGVTVFLGALQKGAAQANLVKDGSLPLNLNFSFLSSSVDQLNPELLLGMMVFAFVFPNEKLVWESIGASQAPLAAQNIEKGHFDQMDLFRLSLDLAQQANLSTDSLSSMEASEIERPLTKIEQLKEAILLPLTRLLFPMTDQPFFLSRDDRSPSAFIAAGNQVFRYKVAEGMGAKQGAVHDFGTYFVSAESAYVEVDNVSSSELLYLRPLGDIVRLNKEELIVDVSKDTGRFHFKAALEELEDQLRELTELNLVVAMGEKTKQISYQNPNAKDQWLSVSLEDESALIDFFKKHARSEGRAEVPFEIPEEIRFQGEATFHLSESPRASPLISLKPIGSSYRIIDSEEELAPSIKEEPADGGTRDISGTVLGHMLIELTHNLALEELGESNLPSLSRIRSQSSLWELEIKVQLKYTDQYVYLFLNDLPSPSFRIRRTDALEGVEEFQGEPQWNILKRGIPIDVAKIKDVYTLMKIYFLSQSREVQEALPELNLQELVEKLPSEIPGFPQSEARASLKLSQIMVAGIRPRKKIADAIQAIRAAYADLTRPLPETTEPFLQKLQESMRKNFLEAKDFVGVVIDQGQAHSAEVAFYKEDSLPSTLQFRFSNADPENFESDFILSMMMHAFAQPNKRFSWNEALVLQNLSVSQNQIKLDSDRSDWPDLYAALIENRNAAMQSMSKSRESLSSELVEWIGFEGVDDDKQVAFLKRLRDAYEDFVKPLGGESESLKDLQQELLKIPGLESDGLPRSIEVRLDKGLENEVESRFYQEDSWLQIKVQSQEVLEKLSEVFLLELWIYSLGANNRTTEWQDINEGISYFSPYSLISHTTQEVYEVNKIPYDQLRETLYEEGLGDSVYYQLEANGAVRLDLPVEGKKRFLFEGNLQGLEDALRARVPQSNDIYVLAQKKQLLYKPEGKEQYVYVSLLDRRATVHAIQHLLSRSEGRSQENAEPRFESGLLEWRGFDQDHEEIQQEIFKNLRAAYRYLRRPLTGIPNKALRKLQEIILRIPGEDSEGLPQKILIRIDPEIGRRVQATYHQSREILEIEINSYEDLEGLTDEFLLRLWIFTLAGYDNALMWNHLKNGPLFSAKLRTETRSVPGSKDAYRMDVQALNQLTSALFAVGNGPSQVTIHSSLKESPKVIAPFETLRTRTGVPFEVNTRTTRDVFVFQNNWVYEYELGVGVGLFSEGGRKLIEKDDYEVELNKEGFISIRNRSENAISAKLLEDYYQYIPEKEMIIVDISVLGNARYFFSGTSEKFGNNLSVMNRRKKINVSEGRLHYTEDESSQRKAVLLSNKKKMIKAIRSFVSRSESRMKSSLPASYSFHPEEGMKINFLLPTNDRFLFHGDPSELDEALQAFVIKPVYSMDLKQRTLSYKSEKTEKFEVVSFSDRNAMVEALQFLFQGSARRRTFELDLFEWQGFDEKDQESEDEVLQQKVYEGLRDAYRLLKKGLPLSSKNAALKKWQKRLLKIPGLELQGLPQKIRVRLDGTLNRRLESIYHSHTGLLEISIRSRKDIDRISIETLLDLWIFSMAGYDHPMVWNAFITQPQFPKKLQTKTLKESGREKSHRFDVKTFKRLRSALLDSRNRSDNLVIHNEKLDKPIRLSPFMSLEVRAKAPFEVRAGGQSRFFIIHKRHVVDYELGEGPSQDPTQIYPIADDAFEIYSRMIPKFARVNNLSDSPIFVRPLESYYSFVPEKDMMIVDLPAQGGLRFVFSGSLKKFQNLLRIMSRDKTLSLSQTTLMYKPSHSETPISISLLDKTGMIEAIRSIVSRSEGRAEMNFESEVRLAQPQLKRMADLSVVLRVIGVTWGLASNLLKTPIAQAAVLQEYASALSSVQVPDTLRAAAAAYKASNLLVRDDSVGFVQMVTLEAITQQTLNELAAILRAKTQRYFTIVVNQGDEAQVKEWLKETRQNRDLAGKEIDERLEVVFLNNNREQRLREIPAEIYARAVRGNAVKNQQEFYKHFVQLSVGLNRSEVREAAVNLRDHSMGAQAWLARSETGRRITGSFVALELAGAGSAEELDFRTFQTLKKEDHRFYQMLEAFFSELDSFLQTDLEAVKKFLRAA